MRSFEALPDVPIELVLGLYEMSAAITFLRES